MKLRHIKKSDNQTYPFLRVPKVNPFRRSEILIIPIKSQILDKGRKGGRKSREVIIGKTCTGSLKLKSIDRLLTIL